MNSIQAIREGAPSRRGPGNVTIDVERERSLVPEDNPAISGFRIIDDGVGLTDENFDSFNTAYSPHKMPSGGKGLGHFMWLKAFESAHITSIFTDNGSLLRRSFVFDEQYDLDDRGLPQVVESGNLGTSVRLTNYRDTYKNQCPRTTEVLIEKVIEHFLLVLLESDRPNIIVSDLGQIYNINNLFDRDYKANASVHPFTVKDKIFTLHGFRLPTSRTSRHKLVYAADQRAVLSDNLEDYLPSLGSRLVDNDGNSFFYLAVVQGTYLSEHVSPGRSDFDFTPVEDSDVSDTGDLFSQITIRRADIRNSALAFVQDDLSNIIQTITNKSVI